MLTGSIPRELGQLSNLESLSLVGNNLIGTIPSTLGELNKLSALSFDRNNLTGTIPSALGKLTNLRWLGFSDNPNFGGSIPTTFTALNFRSPGSLQIQGTGLCMPTRDPHFAEWASVNRWIGESCATKEDRESLIALYRSAGGGKLAAAGQLAER